MQNYVYCQTSFSGWVNLSKQLANITQLQVGPFISLIVSNGSTYTCGAIPGSSMKMASPVKQSFEAVSVGGFQADSYVLESGVLTQMSTLKLL